LVWVAGIGLHSGVPARVVLRRTEGAVVLATGAVHAIVSKLTIASTARATTVEAHGGRLRVATVEHAFAALTALRVHGGLTISIDGPELPLLGGGASEWCAALRRVGVVPGTPRIRVARKAVVEVGASRYEFAPSDGVDISVRFEVDAPGPFDLVPEARWTGDAEDFERRIAPARTFAFARDVTDLAARGLAKHVDPESVVVLAAGAALCAGRPFAPDEPARHKLLDLLGDMYLFGGAPIGATRAVRPGHAANAAALSRARAEGILVAEGC
jgi:UDP-3-O-[3-hydroxymyristoyl] N-acetylglucosamine deacetylase